MGFTHVTFIEHLRRDRCYARPRRYGTPPVMEETQVNRMGQDMVVGEQRTGKTVLKAKRGGTKNINSHKEIKEYED